MSAPHSEAASGLARLRDAHMHQLASFIEENTMTKAGRGRLAGGRRETGRIHGADGGTVIVGTDCDGVTIRTAGARGAATVILSHADREAFSRAYFQACAEADDWAREHEDVPP